MDRLAPDYRRLCRRHPSAQQRGQQVKTRFVSPQDGSAPGQSLFFSWGKRRSRQSRMASSSRRAARSAGFCKLRPQPFRIRPAWEGSQDTPNSLPVTWATRRLVQISPQNPEAAGPWASNSGSWARCSWPSLARLPGCLRWRRACGPSCRALLTHWLTAPWRLPGPGPHPSVSSPSAPVPKPGSGGLPSN